MFGLAVLLCLAFAPPRRFGLTGLADGKGKARLEPEADWSNTDGMLFPARLFQTKERVCSLC